MSNYKYVFNPISGVMDKVYDVALLVIKGAVDTTADLPLTGNTHGDLYVVKNTEVENDNKLYTWNLDETFGTLADWNEIGAVASIDWSVITNKPFSLVADIDDAVTKKHDGSIQDTAIGLNTTHRGLTDNPHNVDKADVGLSDVDNLSEATIISDVKADIDVADAITKKHTQNADTELDTGGSNPVTAKQIVDPKYLIGDTSSQGGLKNEVLSKNINPTNLLLNGSFEYWYAGASSAPDAWNLSGAGAAIAREGTIVKLGSYSAKLTRSGANCFLYFIDSRQDISMNYYLGKTFTFSCWVYATVADRARILIHETGADTYSAYHTGDSTWQLLTVTKTMETSGTQVRLHIEVNTGDTTAYFDGAMLVEGGIPFAYAPKLAEEGVWADYSSVSSVTGWSSFTEKVIMCKRVGSLLFVDFSIASVSNSVSTSFSLPYNSSANNATWSYIPLGFTVDNGAVQATPGHLQLQKTAGTISAFKDCGGTPFTASGVKQIKGQFFYEIQ